MVLFEEIAVGLCILLIYCAIVVFVVKSKFWKRVLLISCFTLTLAGLASSITETSFFKVYVYPENLALEDFDFTDYAMAKLRKPALEDPRVVLVNFGALDRREAAHLINAISHYKPKVIGIDALYNCEGGLRDSINCPQLKDSIGNRMLSDAIRRAGNVVLATKLMQSDSLAKLDSEIADSLELSDPVFSNYAKNGFINLPSGSSKQEDVKVARTLFPRRNVKNKTELAFSVHMALVYDSVKTKKFLVRDNEEEIINFRGNIRVWEVPPGIPQNKELEAANFTIYFVVDFEDVLSGNVSPELFKDKIVVIGYLGDFLGDSAYEDKFFTPINENPYGKSNADMFSPVIQANIISMILDEDYINVLPDDREVLFALLTCIFHVALLLYIGKKFPNWFELISIGLIIFQLFLYSWLRINLFIVFGLKSNLVATITTLAFATISINLCKELYHLSYKKLPVWLQQKI